jgi:tRNA U34 2-thiouridine synthase MnmA/TrmU
MKYIATRGQKERERENGKKQNEIESLVVCAGKETGIEKVIFPSSLSLSLFIYDFFLFIC